MAISSRDNLKDRFKTGDVPSGSDFRDLIDTSFSLLEDIELINSKVPLTDPRLTDDRFPTSHAYTHSVIGDDKIAPIDINAADRIHEHDYIPVLESKPTSGTYTKVSINEEGVVTYGTMATSADIPDLHYIPLTQKAAANGVATLGVDGKIPEYQLPDLSISDTFVVNSEAQMLSLQVQRGDIAVRTDIKETYILKTSPASALVNWQKLETPTDSVISVNGMTGTVIVTNISGSASSSLYSDTAGTANETIKLQTARSISASGDVLGNATNFDGQSNIVIPIYLVDSGVDSGTYNNSTTIHSLSIDSKGRIIGVGPEETISINWNDVIDKPVNWLTFSDSTNTKTPEMIDDTIIFKSGFGINVQLDTLSKTFSFSHINNISPNTISEGSISRVLNFNETFNIPSISYDSQGHITNSALTQLTLPNINNLATLDQVIEKTGVSNSAVIPAGNDLQRDISPAAGYLRFNTISKKFEGFDGITWNQVGTNDNLETQLSFEFSGLNIIDSFESFLYRSVSYEIQLTTSVGYQRSDVKVIHDNKNAYLVESNQMYTADILGDFDVTYINDNIILSCNMYNNETTVNIKKNAISNPGNPFFTIPTDLETGDIIIDLMTGNTTIDLNA